jgi:FtsZ-binding cell division protein ZapB
MITLEQIRLLESKITRAIDLIRVLKEENSTLRKGLESAQRRMRELETLVDGFKTDQKEIESVIVRTLHNLDELEESAATAATEGGVRAGGSPAGGSPAAAPGGVPSAAGSVGAAVPGASASRHAERAGGNAPVMTTQKDTEPASPKEELDIF